MLAADMVFLKPESYMMSNNNHISLKQESYHVTLGCGEPATLHSNTAFCLSGTATSSSSVMNVGAMPARMEKKSENLK